MSPLRRWPPRFRYPVTVALLSVAAATSADAQLPGFGSAPSASPPAPSVSALSPRAAIAEFQRLVRADDLAGAAEYLAVPAGRRDAAPLLARRLQLVLDQRLALDPRRLSPLATGDTADGLANSDRIGLIAGPAGREDVVELVRTPGGVVPWQFTTATVRSVDFWFENLGNPWLRDRLPPTLMREGPLHLFLWQWIGLFVAVPVILLASWLLTFVLLRVVGRITARTSTTWDDLLVDHLRGPARLWIAAIISAPVLALLDLNARLSGFVTSVTRVMVLLSLFWAIIRAIHLVQLRMESVEWGGGHTQQARTLAPLVGNFLRVMVIAMAILVALSQFGYPVGTLLAGLGIGGIAVALAAQKTVEHLFGSISLAADRAFRVGDWVRAGATEGAVERIGLRSTSFRTNDRTVVRVPNGRLADERIETFGERDRILLKTPLDLNYGTSIEQVQSIREQIRTHIAAHPKVWPDAVQVHVTEFAESSIRLSVMAWFITTNYTEFLEIRHNMLLDFLRIIESNGSSFAYPSRTIYHVTADGTVHTVEGSPDGLAPVAVAQTGGGNDAAAGAP